MDICFLLGFNSGLQEKEITTKNPMRTKTTTDYTVYSDQDDGIKTEYVNASEIKNYYEMKKALL